MWQSVTLHIAKGSYQLDRTPYGTLGNPPNGQDGVHLNNGSWNPWCVMERREIDVLWACWL